MSNSPVQRFNNVKDSSGHDWPGKVTAVLLNETAKLEFSASTQIPSQGI